MTYAGDMLSQFPGSPVADAGRLTACIDACFACAQTCNACADACLSEERNGLQTCIRLDLDCADQCIATGNAVTRQTAASVEILRSSLTACRDACQRCAEECAQHARHGMEHCATCARACRACEQACGDLLSALAA